ncbi:MAG: molybdopterin-guanine dinucleotide biosynthesis protein B [Candidatus Bathyarchaeia archaeon]
MPGSKVAIAVLGGKASGKTIAVEIIVRTLNRKGFSVMTVKHVAHPGFTLDREGTDTWRHWKAGAKIVATVSDVETGIMIKGQTDLSWDLLNSFIEADIIVFEGFSSKLLKDKGVGKIICLKDISEKTYYLNNLRGALIALCSLRLEGEGILRLGLEDTTLSAMVLEFVQTKMLSG